VKKRMLDPVSQAAQEIVPLAQEASQLGREPLRSWLLGLCELKVVHGHSFPWEDLIGRLYAAAKAVADTPSDQDVLIKDQKGASLRLDEAQRKVCSEFARAPLKKRQTLSFLQRYHPDLWDRLRQAAGASGRKRWQERAVLGKQLPS